MITGPSIEEWKRATQPPRPLSERQLSRLRQRALEMPRERLPFKQARGSLNPSSIPMPTRADRAEARRILARVAETYGTTPDDIMSDDRRAYIFIARMRAMYEIYCLVESMNQSEIGRMFKRHPSTVLHALRVEARRSGNTEGRS